MFLQAKSIVKSLLIDFNKIPNIKVIHTWDNRLKKLTKKKNIECIVVKHNPIKKWKTLIKKVDFFLPIAPESKNQLINLIRLDNKKNKRKVNDIKIVSSKFKTFKFFKENSIPTINTYNKLNKINFHIYKEWVLKPDDGVGCEKNYIFKKNKKLISFFKKNKNFIIQPLLKGLSYSANIVLTKKKKPLIINFNKQNIKYKKKKIVFNGTRYIKNIPLKNEIIKNINFISNKLPGLTGFFGIDFIIFKKEIFFLDINPRITTSYKNINKNLKIKIAKKILNTL